MRDESGTEPSQEGEALITLHIQFIASNCPNNPTNERVGKADIQFNSLDVIGEFLISYIVFSFINILSLPLFFSLIFFLFVDFVSTCMSQTFCNILVTWGTIWQFQMLLSRL